MLSIIENISKQLPGNWEVELRIDFKGTRVSVFNLSLGTNVLIAHRDKSLEEQLVEAISIAKEWGVKEENLHRSHHKYN